MKIISWNVNSLRVRIEQILQILKEEKPDFLCLQETKIIDDQFPTEEFLKQNYFSYFKGMPSYNGVAVISKEEAQNVQRINFCKENDARHISINISGMEIMSVYVPAGGEEPDPKINPKFKHKLFFLKELFELLKKKRTKKILLCGDLNIAPYEDDVWSHKKLVNVVSHTDIERKELIRILYENNFTDAIRFFLNPPSNIFTWWSYRSSNYKVNNRGRRLDHIWVSSVFSEKLKSARILKKYRDNKKPSDHVPVCLELNVNY